MHQHSALLILLAHLFGSLAGYRQLALLLSFSPLAGQLRCCDKVSGSIQSLLRPKFITGNLLLLPCSIGCDQLQAHPDRRVVQIDSMSSTRARKSQYKRYGQGGKNNWSHNCKQTTPHRHASFLQKHLK